MGKLEDFQAWVDRLPAWCRWFFAFLLTLGLIGAAIFFTFYSRRTDPVIQTGNSSAEAGGDLNRQTGAAIGGMGKLVGEDLDAVERDRQALARDSESLVDASRDFIAEAKREGGQGGK